MLVCSQASLSFVQDSLTSMGLLEFSTLTSAAKVTEKHNSNVALFLNRILGLKVERQTLVSSPVHVVLV